MFLGNLASGMLWGPPIAYWSFFLPVEYQLFCIVILIGLGTGAIYSNYIVLPVVYAFEIPALAPPSSRWRRSLRRCTSPWWRAESPMWPPRWRSRTTCIARTWTPCGWATRTWRCWSRCGARKRARAQQPGKIALPGRRQP
ncbi:hypothetical protein WJ970_11015 [Achromobacter xylosoxidans]